MAGERRLDGDLRGLKVADFADENDVGILTQEAAEKLGECEFLFGVDLALHQSSNVVFNGILGGEDLYIDRVELIERGVERGGLSRTSRASDDDDAVGLVDHRAHAIEVIIAQANLVERKLDIGTVKHAKHDRLAEHGRKNRHAQVDRGLAEMELDTTVLRQTPLGDVELGHDLDAGDQRGGEGLGNLLHLVEHAVDAVAQLELVFEGLEVDIAGLVLNGDHEDQLHEFDDGVVVGGVGDGAEVERVVRTVLQRRNRRAAGDARDVESSAPARVAGGEDGIDVGGLGDHRAHAHA